MRQVLRRATEFTADVSALSDDLTGSATQIRAAAESLSGNPDDAEKRITELTAFVEQLSRQAARLDARLKELQFRDKLYIEEEVPDSGTMSRLKALILGKK
jgi:methyl-accepting chemotaxis protein